MIDEIRSTQMSTNRMKGPNRELHVSIFFYGPRGGSRELVRLDTVEANKLLRALAKACAQLEEAVNAANFRRRDTKEQEKR